MASRLPRSGGSACIISRTAAWHEALRIGQEDNPRSDLLTLAGGQGNPVVVQMIAAGGRAEQAGVKPGQGVMC